MNKSVWFAGAAIAAAALASFVPSQGSAAEAAIPPGAEFKALTWTYPATTGSPNMIAQKKAGLPRNLVDGGVGNGSFAVLTDEGIVWTWGSNTVGELGDGTTTSRDQPAPVPSLTNITRIAVNSAHKLALRADGTVWAWGANDFFQLGDGTHTNRSTPVQVSGLSNIVQISAGLRHGFAIRNDGTVWAWGHNGFSQLGDGTTTGRKTPVQVVGLTAIKAVAAGDNFGLALRGDGTVWSWGNNADGQLGDGTHLIRRTPVRITDLAGITQVAAGSNHAFAMTANPEELWAWGSNAAGKLGDGTTLSRNRPMLLFRGNVGVSQIAASTNHGHHSSYFNTLTWGQVEPVPAALSPSQFISGAEGAVRLAAGANQGMVIALESVLVPHVRAHTETRARDLLTQSMLSVSSIKVVGSSSCHDIGNVMASDPPADTRVQLQGGKGSVSLTIARYCEVRVPNLLESRNTDVNAILSRAELVRGSTTFVTDPYCTSIDRVVSQSPEANTFLTVGAAVNVTLGKRPTGKCLPPP